MSDKTLSITITAKDAASPVFKQVATGAETMGKAVDQAGKTGGSGLDQMSKRAAAFGAALTATGALLGQWNRSAQDAAAIQRQLEQAIANTGQSFAQYAGAIERAQTQAVQLGIDDEKAAQAIQALTEITGNAGTALDLLGTAEDLSAAKGMDLVSAAELIGKVHEGNVGILQRYGVVVQQGASAEEALAQIQAQTAGQAEAHATTYARLREELANVTDAIGGTVGQFAPFLQLLPGLSSGIALVGGAIGALVPEMAAAEAGALALDVALGPVGLVLAAGAAVGALVLLSQGTATYSTVASRAAQVTSTFDAELATLRASGSAAADDFQTVADTFGGMLQAQTDLAAAIAANAKEQGGFTVGSADVLDATQINDIRTAILDLFQNAFVDADKVTAELTGLFAQFDDGTISADDLTAAIQADADQWYRFAAGADAAAASLGPVGDAIKKATDAMRPDVLSARGEGSTARLAKDLDNIAHAAGTAGDVARTRAVALGDAVAAGTVQLAAYEQQIHDLAGSVGDYQQQAKLAQDTTAGLGRAHEIAARQQDEAKTAADAYAQAMTAQHQAQAAALGTFADVHAAIGGLSDDIFAVADGLSSQVTALDRVAAGSTSAAVALSAFKEVQDGILAQQDVFNQQYSEYGSQLSAIERAQKILNDRQAEGLPITKDQQEFLDGAAAAQERLTGGQEDAAIAAGELAVAYGDNMSKGDAMNASLDGVAKTSGDLTKAIRDLIGALQGVPPDTHANVEVTGAGDGTEDVHNLDAALNAIDGKTAHTYVVNTTSNVVNNVINDVRGGLGFRDGGVVGDVLPRGRARNGLATGGGMVVTVGEAGPEHVLLPAGSYVRTAAATSAARGGHGQINLTVNTGPIHGFAGVDEFAAALSRTLQTHLAGVGF